MPFKMNSTEYPADVQQGKCKMAWYIKQPDIYTKMDR